MRRLKIMEYISLDGVVQAFRQDDFPYADWTAAHSRAHFVGIKKILATGGSLR
jgi:hypothetical protein